MLECLAVIGLMVLILSVAFAYILLAYAALDVPPVR